MARDPKGLSQPCTASVPGVLTVTSHLLCTLSVHPGFLSVAWADKNGTQSSHLLADRRAEKLMCPRLSPAEPHGNSTQESGQ